MVVQFGHSNAGFVRNVLLDTELPRICSRLSFLPAPSGTPIWAINVEQGSPFRIRLLDPDRIPPWP
ncbi:MAG: hypothetical protein JWQ07_5081 [Ramlibacter sp.]|nr:hypothetical protein [Ramlibacter sp.]